MNRSRELGLAYLGVGFIFRDLATSLGKFSKARSQLLAVFSDKRSWIRCFDSEK